MVPGPQSWSYRSSGPQSQQFDLEVGRAACPPPLIGAFRRESGWFAYAPNTGVVFSVDAHDSPPGCAMSSRPRLLLAASLLLAAIGLGVRDRRRLQREAPVPVGGGARR